MRKILQKIFGEIQEAGQWAIRKNRKLKELYGSADIVLEPKSIVYDDCQKIQRKTMDKMAGR